jgi:hypothetical protein
MLAWVQIHAEELLSTGVARTGIACGRLDEIIKAWGREHAVRPDQSMEILLHVTNRQVHYEWDLV